MKILHKINIKRTISLFINIALIALLSFSIFACKPADSNKGDDNTSMTKQNYDNQEDKSTEANEKTQATIQDIIKSVRNSTPFTHKATIDLKLGEEVDFTANIIKTPPMRQTIGKNVQAHLIKSKEEFEQYLNQHQINWQFLQNSANDLLENYNANYFADKALIVGVFASSSGSTTIKTDYVGVDSDTIYLNFKVDYPQIGTTDMMSWHYFIEVKADDIKEAKNIKSNLPSSKSQSPGIEYATE